MGSGTRMIEPEDSDAIEGLKQALLKLPKIHLLGINAFVGHLAELTTSTKTEGEDDTTYLIKIGLSLGRCQSCLKECCTALSFRFLISV
jgi:hypothetical protein